MLWLADEISKTEFALEMDKLPKLTAAIGADWDKENNKFIKFRSGILITQRRVGQYHSTCWKYDHSTFLMITYALGVGIVRLSYPSCSEIWIVCDGELQLGEHIPYASTMPFTCLSFDLTKSCNTSQY